MIACCVGITAYNEEANIGRLLEALLAQQSRIAKIVEIIVVASGCTDRTEDVVEGFMRRDPRIRLLRQAQREGKASAVNLLLRSTQCGIIALESADTIPLPETMDALMEPFQDPKIGMVGGRPIPTNSPDHFMGYGVHLLWKLHHLVSLHNPKMGELIAFRNVFQQIPMETAVDEASIEPLIIGQGMRLSYAPRAVVRNKGPETARDFIKQRRRIFVGHLYVKDTLGYKVSTLNSLRMLWLFLINFQSEIQPWNWRHMFWAPAIGLLETYVRILATYDYIFHHSQPYVWPVAETTKDLAEVS
ncbi:MAG TPA: glycosyltransferase [Anaerolineales bacterium]